VGEDHRAANVNIVENLFMASLEIMPYLNARNMTSKYEQFLSSKRIIAKKTGIEIPKEKINPVLYDWQRDIVQWALRRGKAALFEDCGLGKTLQQLEWARHVGGRVLIVAPLTVNEQTIREGKKLNLEVRNVRDRSEIESGINITNYEMISHFIGADLNGIILDESSILKSVDGATKKILLEHFTDVPFRLCCTATPCPNDIAEIANHSEFLGIMKRQEMLASFFVHDEDGWRLRGHAVKPFYRWLASWAMAIKSPADLGYDASMFVLPELLIHDVIVPTTWRRDGRLFAGGLQGIGDRVKIRKQSVKDRVAEAARIATESKGQVIIWCGLNDEAVSVCRSIPESENLQGNDSHDRKKDVIGRFLSGELKILVTKGRIAGFGMNFQCAHTMIFMGLGDSYEMYYQCIRREYRFGQKNPVDVYIVVTDHELEIVENVRRKEVEAETLSREIVSAAKEYEMEELGIIQHEEVIERGEYQGKDWKLYQGDSADEMNKLADDLIDLSIFSPPFLALYTYSATERDLGNCRSDKDFFDHFRFIIDGLLRVTKPGRLCCVHAAQTATTLTTHGVIGMKDFRGMLCENFVQRGWIYQGEVCIDKDPQAQAIRTHSKGLLFVQLKKDASWLRPAMADYILVFRKPGENQVPIHPDIDNNEWIEWARPIWYGIKESDTLNRAEARSEEDDRHVCPLQLGTIERCVRLWSNPGETIFSPFAGIGSEGVGALKNGRKFIGIELKSLYARTGARNLARADNSNKSQSSLFADE
jgi:DNA modification methylase